jgi:hypothetical protein
MSRRYHQRTEKTKALNDLIKRRFDDNKTENLEVIMSVDLQKTHRVKKKL